MFQIGDLIVYGGEGVCRVEAVSPLELSDMKSDKLYYTLSPIYQTGTVFAPVEGKAFMRPIMTREQAQDIAERFFSIPEESLKGKSARAVGELYQSMLESHDCTRLVQLIRTIDRKQRRAYAAGRKSCQMDERYRKRAEDALYGELAAVLGMDRAEVEDYIRKTAESAKKAPKTAENG